MSSAPFAFQPAREPSIFSFGSASASAPSFLGDLSLSSGSSGTIGSSPVTPLEGSPFPPSDISFSGSKSFRTSIGSGGNDSHAYTLLVRSYQEIEREYHTEKQNHNALKATHDKLVDTHNMLMAAFVQRSHLGDRAPNVAISGSHLPEEPRPLEHGKNAWTMSRTDYPGVKYWTRADWAKRRVADDDTETQPGPRGGSRCAKGENVMTRYIECADGRPVSGAIASQIREYARSIWRGLYDRGLAPATWGNASREIEDRFNDNMEREWPVLRYCDSHWKTKHLAISIYSQWYSTYHEAQAQKKHKVIQKRKQCDDNNSQTTKKPKTASQDALNCNQIEDDDEVEISTNIHPLEDISDSEDRQAIQEVVTARTSRPKARPLRDPLANVFDRSNGSPFQVLDTVPDVVSPAPAARPIETQPTETQPSCSMPDGDTNPPDRTTNTIDATATGPSIDRSDSSASTSITDYPLHQSTAADGSVPPIAASLTPLAGTVTSPSENRGGPSVPPAPTITEPEGTMTNAAQNHPPAALMQKRYLRTNKMVPSEVGLKTARQFAAADWCTLHPEGTEGEFNMWWDSLDKKGDAMKEYKKKEYQASKEAREARKTNRLPPRRAPRNVDGAA